ncbi:MAG TPA: (2Fe-2S)-binding protein [Verrucomicrobiae bacterium]|nr:(2Fe-2S)-binding protein [Verrucomicrobiae bacterium]
MHLKITVNGKEFSLNIKGNERLIDVLRDHLGLTGTKEGCGEGECGACTVLLDGDAVNSCLVLAAQAHARSITTIEGLGTRRNPHPLQTAFVTEGAVQCGFCTPGMILSAKALLDKNPKPTALDIKSTFAGNLCRCTGYDKIFRAIQRVVEEGNGND